MIESQRNLHRTFYFGVMSITFKHTILITVMCTDVFIILNGKSISEHFHFRITVRL